jgi:hypothetical protein
MQFPCRDSILLSCWLKTEQITAVHSAEVLLTWELTLTASSRIAEPIQ